MSTLFYTSGQAARELGSTQGEIRNLCQAGAIAAEITQGGQWRIPKAELDRLKRDGLPPIPRPLPSDISRPAGPRRPHPALLDEPSDDAIAAADEVVVLENEVKALGLRRHKEEQLDWFRERDDREAERREAKERQEHESSRQAEAERRRCEWTDKWTDHALRVIPWDAPQESHLDVAEAARAALDGGNPSHPDTLTERLVEAAVERALTPWRRSKETENAIERACDSLPWLWRSAATRPVQFSTATTSCPREISTTRHGDLVSTFERRLRLATVTIQLQSGRRAKTEGRGLPVSS